MSIQELLAEMAEKPILDIDDIKLVFEGLSNYLTDLETENESLEQRVKYLEDKE